MLEINQLISWKLPSQRVIFCEPYEIQLLQYIVLKQLLSLIKYPLFREEPLHTKNTHIKFLLMFYFFKSIKIDKKKLEQLSQKRREAGILKWDKIT